MNDENSVEREQPGPRLQPRGNRSVAGGIRDANARQSMRTDTVVKGSPDRPESGGDGTEEGDGATTIGERNRGPYKAPGGPVALQGAGEGTGGTAQGLAPDDGPKDRSVRGGVSKDAEKRAKILFSDIGQRFNENRKRNKASAYEAYQRDLMDNLDTLVMGGVITLKEITATITDLEQFMRQNTGETGKSQAQLLSEWLVADITEFTANP